MSPPRVLYVSHNHPDVRPGGAETYALELFRAMKKFGSYSPILLAKAGPPMSADYRPHPHTPFAKVNSNGDEYFFYTDHSDFDPFYGTFKDKSLYTTHLRRFLEAYRPDVVHFQHTHFIGYDAIRITHQTLPRSAIVYTLHEFLPICYRQGQMVRTVAEELCERSSPLRCHECFPKVSAQAFFLRKRFIESHFSLVDMFLAPSHFLRERYIEWGIPPDRIRFEDYGRVEVDSSRLDESDRPAIDGAERRNRFGFFGQFTRFKGADVLLRAMKILSQNGSDAHLWLHGANLEMQPSEYQDTFHELLAATRGNVTFAGRYEPWHIGRLMESIDWVVVPSIWWENSPLVIQEGFLHGRPIICSDVGGMAEKVNDGKDGLHFKLGDHDSLADVIQRAADSPGLWEKLRSGISPVYAMTDHATSLTALYDELLAANARKTS